MTSTQPASDKLSPGEQLIKEAYLRTSWYDRLAPIYPSYRALATNPRNSLCQSDRDFLHRCTVIITTHWIISGMLGARIGLGLAAWICRRPIGSLLSLAKPPRCRVNDMAASGWTWEDAAQLPAVRTAALAGMSIALGAYHGSHVGQMTGSMHALMWFASQDQEIRGRISSMRRAEAVAKHRLMADALERGVDSMKLLGWLQR